MAGAEQLAKHVVDIFHKGSMAIQVHLLGVSLDLSVLVNLEIVKGMTNGPRSVWQSVPV